MRLALSLDHVRSFVAVAQERHFGRAAQRLSLTQPPLTRQVQRLERDVGARLLDRTPHGVELTDAGRAFLPDAQRLLALAEAAVCTARRAACGGAGVLAIGYTPLSGMTVLGGLLQRIEAARPGVRLVLHERSSTHLVEALRTGAVDLALLRPPVDPQVADVRRLVREALVLAAPAGHPLVAAADPLPVAALAGVPLLTYSGGPSRYLAQRVHHVLTGVRYEPAGAVDEVHTLLALVAAGRGVGVVPACAAGLAPAGVRIRPLLTDPAEPVDLCLAWRQGASHPALLAALPHLLPVTGGAS